MVTFHDNRHRDSDLLSIEGCTPLLTWANGSKFRLMCEFDALDEDCCLLRLEYDTHAFSRQSISHMVDIILGALEGLIADIGYADLRTRLQDLSAQGHKPQLKECVAFGTAVSSFHR
jgi:hypothetical protein